MAETKSINRYGETPCDEYPRYVSLDLSADGDWVQFDDHERVVKQLAEALKECITEDGACCLAHNDKAMMKQRLAYITQIACAALKAAGIE